MWEFSPPTPLPRVIKSVSFNYFFFFLPLGSGASCIYPLLGAKLNNWHFLATEVDESSVSYARENIKCNGLENKIKGMEMSRYMCILRMCRYEFLLNTCSLGCYILYIKACMVISSSTSNSIMNAA